MHSTAREQQRFSIRKLTIGAASVLLGTALFWAGSNQVKADENNNADTMSSKNEAQTAEKGKVTDNTVQSSKTGNIYTTQNELKAKQKSENNVPQGGAESPTNKLNASDQPVNDQTGEQTDSSNSKTADQKPNAVGNQNEKLVTENVNQLIDETAYQLDPSDSKVKTEQKVTEPTNPFPSTDDVMTFHGRTRTITRTVHYRTSQTMGGIEPMKDDNGNVIQDYVEKYEITPTVYSDFTLGQNYIYFQIKNDKTGVITSATATSRDQNIKVMYDDVPVPKVTGWKASSIKGDNYDDPTYFGGSMTYSNWSDGLPDNLTDSQTIYYTYDISSLKPGDKVDPKYRQLTVVDDDATDTDQKFYRTFLYSKSDVNDHDHNTSYIENGTTEYFAGIQSLEFTRTKTTNADGTVTYGQWTPKTTATSPEFTWPSIPGYSVAEGDNNSFIEPALTIDPNKGVPTLTYNAAYLAKYKVSIIDDTTETTLRTVTGGVPEYNTDDTTVDLGDSVNIKQDINKAVDNYKNQGYVVVSDDFNTKDISAKISEDQSHSEGADNDARFTYTIHLKHGVKAVTATKQIKRTIHYVANGKSGDKLLNDSTQTVNLKATGLYLDATKTYHTTPTTADIIAVTDANGNTYYVDTSDFVNTDSITNSDGTTTTVTSSDTTAVTPTWTIDTTKTNDGTAENSTKFDFAQVDTPDTINDLTPGRTDKDKDAVWQKVTDAVSVSYDTNGTTTPADGYVIYEEVATKHENSKSATRTIHYVDEDGNTLTPEENVVTKQTVNFHQVYYTANINGVDTPVNVHETTDKDGNTIYLVNPADSTTGAKTADDWDVVAPVTGDNATEASDKKSVSYNKVQQDEITLADGSKWYIQKATKGSYKGDEETDNNQIVKYIPTEIVTNTVADKNNEDVYLVYHQEGTNYNVHYIDVTGSDKTSGYTKDDGTELTDHEVKDILDGITKTGNTPWLVGDKPDATSKLSWDYKDDYVLVGESDNLAKQALTAKTPDQYVYLMRRANKETEQKSASRTIHYVENTTSGKELIKDTTQSATIEGTYYVDATDPTKRVNHKQITDLNGNKVEVVTTGDATETWAFAKNANGTEIAHPGVTEVNGKFIFAGVTDPKTINDSTPNRTNNDKGTTWNLSKTQDDGQITLDPNDSTTWPTSSTTKDLTAAYLIYTEQPSDGGDNGGNVTPPVPNIPKDHGKTQPTDQKPGKKETPKDHNKKESPQPNKPHTSAKSKNSKTTKKQPWNRNTHTKYEENFQSKQAAAFSSNSKLKGTELSEKVQISNSKKVNIKNTKTLPQTGEKQNNASIFGLALATIAGWFGFVGDRKRRN